MPRNGSGVYSLPAGLPLNGETSDATDDIRTPFSDIETDMNTARPIVAGGTGATSASAARTNLGLAIGTDVQAYSAALASWAGVTRASGFDTFVATPSSANLRALLSDEAGTGVAYFVGGALGTPSSGTLTNCAGLPFAGIDAAAVITSSETIASNNNDTTIPTSAAVKAYADSVTGPIRAWVNFNGVPANGTYSRTGTLVTVTLTGHGMTTGMNANLDFTTGTATDGSYTVTVTDANTFTVTDAASGTTSGNVTRNLFIRASLNVSSITDNGTGDYTINFASALADANYAVTALRSNDGSSFGVSVGAQTANNVQINTRNTANAVLNDASTVCVTVVR